MTPKIVKFSMDLGEPPKDTSKEEGEKTVHCIIRQCSFSTCAWTNISLFSCGISSFLPSHLQRSCEDQ